MIAEFILPDDRRWLEFLSSTNHDCYHLPEYVAFAAHHEGGVPCAFFASVDNHALLVPLLRRKLPISLEAPADWSDVLTPYGFPGPLISGSPSSETVTAMVEAFLAKARLHKIVSAFWRLHPLLPFPLQVLSRCGTLIRHGRTVYIDLSLSPEQMWQQTSQNHRRHIRKLQKNGFTVVHNNWRFWKLFIAAYREAMVRFHANAFYAFSDAYFEELRKTLGERLHLWCVLSPEGEVAAAALFIAVNGIVQYHLGTTVEKFVDQSPLKLLIHEGRLWAKEAGNRVLHLGGGVGGSKDTLYTFKSRYSELSTDFHTFRSVIMPKAYSSLTARSQGNESEHPNSQQNFFPAYRSLE